MSSPDEELTVCTEHSDLEATDGQRAVVVGTYTQVDLSKHPNHGPVYGGHVGLKLSDTFVHFGPTWSSDAERSDQEIERCEGETVRAVGTVTLEMPRPPESRAHIIGPCLHPVEQVAPVE